MIVFFYIGIANDLIKDKNKITVAVHYLPSVISFANPQFKAEIALGGQRSELKYAGPTAQNWKTLQCKWKNLECGVYLHLLRGDPHAHVRSVGFLRKLTLSKYLQSFVRSLGVRYNHLFYRFFI